MEYIAHATLLAGKSTLNKIIATDKLLLGIIIANSASDKIIANSRSKVQKFLLRMEYIAHVTLLAGKSALNKLIVTDKIIANTGTCKAQTIKVSS